MWYFNPRFLTVLFLCSVWLHLSGNNNLAKEHFSNSKNHAFLVNKGQVTQTNGKPANQVKYYYKGDQVSVYFRENGWSYVFKRKKDTQEIQIPTFHQGELSAMDGNSKANTVEYYRMDVNVVGANQMVNIEGQQESRPYYNYYLGQSSEGATQVASHEKLVYENVYPGTDLEFYFSNGRLKYDFKVSEAKNPERIKLRYKAAEHLEAKAFNQLKIETPFGTMQETIPAVYAETSSGRAYYKGSYEVKKNTVAFNIGNRTSTNGDLVIDPRLDWSTFLGGSQGGFVDEQITSIEVSDSQNVYVCGVTGSPNFPTTTGAFQSNLGGSQDAFVSKFDEAGNLQWSTLYGGSAGTGFDEERFTDLAVDSNGDVYLTGQTEDSNFPVTNNAYQSNLAGGGSFVQGDAVIVKLSNSGQQLYSTYYGGEGSEAGHGIAVDSSGNIFIAGTTGSTQSDSPPFPLLNAFDNTLSSAGFGGSDGYLVKFDENWSRQWSTYYGGDDEEDELDVAITRNQKILIGGQTRSNNFIATSNAFQTTKSGGFNESFFVGKLTQGGQRTWGTYIGGSNSDFTLSLTADMDGDIFVAGRTQSGDFPVDSNAYQAFLKGNTDGVLFKLDSAGQNNLWSTYLGGSSDESITGVTLGTDGRIYLAGWSSSNNYPTTFDRYSAYPNQTGSGFNGASAAFSVFNDTGGLSYSSFIGGSNQSRYKGLDLDSANSIYMAGLAEASDYPTTSNSYQPNISGAPDAIITKVNCILKPELSVVGPSTFCQGDSTTLKIDSKYDSYQWSNGKTDSVITVQQAGTYSATVTTNEGCYGETREDTINVSSISLPQITYSGNNTICGSNDSIELSVFNTYNSYQWNTGATTRSIYAKNTGNYNVTVTNNAGCQATSNSVFINQVPAPDANIQVNGDTTFCKGNTIQLDAGSGYSAYDWNTGQTTRTIDVTTADTFSVIVINGFGCRDTSDPVITNTLNSPDPTLINLGEDTLCLNDTTQLTVDSTYSSYQWSNGAISDTIDVNQPADYFVTVSNTANCSSTSDTTTLAREESPSITPSNPQPICKGDTLSLSAASGYASYQWNTGDTTQSIQVTTPGQYFVATTDTSGCVTNSDTINVPPKNKPTPSVSANKPPSICPGQSITLTTDSTYNSYQWNTGDTSASIQVNASGDYFATVVDDEGCILDSDTLTVQAKSTPSPTITANGPTSFCQGNSVTLSTSNPYSAYEWSNGDTTRSTVITTSGNYEVVVTDSIGCIDTSAQQSVTVFPKPNISVTANGPTEFCQGNSVTLDAGSGYAIYSWSNGETTQTIDVGTTGNYSVTVFNGLGCSSQSQVVSVTAFSPDPTINAPNGTNACQGDTIPLKTDSPFESYNWNTGDTTRMIEFTQQGNYQVAVTDTNGCQDTSSQVFVAVNDTPKPSIQVLDSAEICSGDSTTLTTPNAFQSYTWTNGDTTRQAEVAQPGNISVTAINTDGCSGTSSPQNIDVNPLPDPSITVGKDTICPTDSSLLATNNSYEGYQWSRGDTSSTIYAQSDGTYNVKVTDSNNCSKASDSVTIEQYTAPTPVVSTNNGTILCEGDSTQLNLQQTYASYDWGMGATASDTTVFEQGSYDVTVTDSNGCQGTSNQVSVTVNDTPQPSIQVLDTNEFCVGDSTRLQTQNTYQDYNWTNGDTTRQITVFQSSNLAVTTTNTDGCSGTSSQQNVQVNPLPDPSVTVSKDTICPSDSSLLSTNNSYESYQWSNGDTSSSIYVKNPGDYNVRVTDNKGCSQASDSVTIEDFTAPSPLITISNGTEFCEGDSTTLGLQQSYTAYDWGMGVTASDTTVFEQGNYDVKVTDSNGCQGTSNQVSITVNDTPQPSIQVLDTNEFCIGDSTRLQTQNTYQDYSWTNGDRTRQITVFQSSNLAVTTTNTDGCSGTSSQQNIQVNPLPDPSITVSKDTICPSDSSLLSTNNSYEAYQWSNGDTSSSIYVKNPGDYNVRVTDNKGCSKASDSLTIEDFTAPTPVITSSNATEFCEGDSTTLGLQQSYTAYDWGMGATASDTTVFDQGNYDVTVTDSNGCTSTANDISITVYDNPQPAVKTQDDTSFCNGDTIQIYADSVYVGYQWSSGETTQFIDQADSISPRVTVTDTNGCVGTSSRENYQVYELPEPPLSTSGPTAFCEGDSVTLTGGTGYQSYQWEADTSGTFDTVTTNRSVKVKSTGNYRLGVVDSNQCFNYSDTIDVLASEPDPLIDYSRTEVLCDSQDSLELEAGNEFASYQWSNGDTSSAIYVDSNGTFEVFVVDTLGCSDTSQEVSITRESNPQPTISYASNDTVCRGTPANLQVDQTYEAYDWDNGDTSRIGAFFQQGSYGVTVTDSNGCQGISSSLPITVLDTPKPVVEVIDTNVVCAGETVELRTQNTYPSYSWSNSNQQQQITVTQSDSLSVTVTDTNQCTGTSGKTGVRVRPNPTPSITSMGTDTICQGDSVNLATVNDYEAYGWNTSDTTRSIFVKQTGNYNVTVTDSSGCSNQTSNKFIKVNPNPTPTITFTDDSLCSGDSAVLSTANGYEDYDWNTGETASSIVVDTAGQYAVTVTDSNGCNATSGAQPIAVLDNPQPVVEVLDTSVFCQGDSSRLQTQQAYDQYDWSPGNLQSRQIKVGTQGDYSVTVTDSNNCTGTAPDQTIQVQPLPKPSVNVNQDTICPSDSSLLTTQNSYEGYQWSRGDTTSSIYAKNAGDYNVVVTDSNGCSKASDSVTLEEYAAPAPVITATNGTVLCEGDSTTLGLQQSYATYDWGLGATDADTTVFEQGNYGVTVTDSDGCQGSASQVSITVNDTPQPSIQVLDSSVFCNGDSARLQTPSTYQDYLWTTGDTTRQATVFQPGNVSVTATNANGCSGKSAPQNITVNPLPQPTIMVSQDTICPSDSSLLTTQNSYEGYQWSRGDTTSSIYAKNSGDYNVVVTDANGCSKASDSATIEEYVAPTPVITANNGTVLCEGDSTKLSLQQSYASYDWGFGATGPDTTVFEQGNYGVTVTNSNGCQGTASQVSITVNDTPQPSIQVLDSSVFCNGDSARLQTPSTYQGYLWTNGDTTREATVFQQGNVSVTATNADGCQGKSAPQNITVNPLPQPAITVSQDTVCPSDSSLLTTQNSYEGYQWSRGDTTSSIYAKNPGDYNVVVTDANGCSKASDSVSIEEYVAPTPIITANNGNVLCEGDSTTLGLQQSYASYDWGFGATGPDTTVFEQGNYDLTVTDSNGCQGTASQIAITVNDTPQPSIQVLDNSSFCQGDSARLQTANTYQSYSWNNNASNRQITVFNQGNYQVTVANSDGCTGISNTQNIVVNNNPSPSIATNPNDTICQGDSVQLTTQNNYQGYAWSTGNSTASIKVGTTDTFDVMVTDANGCEGMDSQFVKVWPTPSATVNINGADTLCRGETTNLSTPNLYSSYSWNTGATSTAITVDTAGTYEVVVTDSNGCQDTSAAVDILVNDTPQPSIQVLDSSVICNGDSTRLQTAGTYQGYSWNNGGTSRQTEVDTQGNYQVMVTDANGCMGTSASENVTVNARPSPSIVINGNDSICSGDSVAITTNQNYAGYNWTTADTSALIYAKAEQDYGVTVTAQNGCTDTASPVSIEVIGRPNPSISAQGPTTFCAGDSVKLEVDNTFAGYAWNNNETTQSITVKQAGNFRAVVNNGFGCQDTSNVITTKIKQRIDEPIRSTLGNDFCEGDTTTLSVDTLAYQAYTWSNNVVDTSIEVAQSGQYSVERIDTNNCLTRDTLAITVNPQPDPLPSVTPVQGSKHFCYGDSIEVELTNSFPGNSWSNGDTGPTTYVDTTQAVYNKVTDQNNCQWNSDTLQVTASIANASIDVVDSTVICQGDSSELKVDRSFEVYEWSNDSSTRSISVSEAGNYSVKGIDSIGCTATSDSIAITVNPLPEPSLAVSNDTLACQGDSVELGLANQTFEAYQWNNGDNSSSISVGQADTFRVTVTDSNACTNTSDAVVVNFKANPEPSLDSTGALAFCEGDSVTLASNSSYPNYDWSTGVNDSLITVKSSGDYSLTVSDSIGCTGTTDTLNIEVDPIQKPDLSPDNAVLCSEESVTLDPGNAYADYEWSNGSRQSSIEVSNSGEYYVEVSANSNCNRVSDTVNVTVKAPLPEPEIIERGDSLIAGIPTEDYQWFLDGDPLANVNDRQILIESSGKYEVQVIDSNGCQARSKPFEVQEVAFEAFPNPVEDFIYFKIETLDEENIGYQLLDVAGNVLIDREVANYEGIFRGRLPMTAYSPGLYILRVVTESEQKEVKFYKGSRN